MMMIPGKNFCTRPSREYETTSLRTPYRLIALMLNRIFRRENGKNLKIGWVPVIFFVATKGTIFNWENIVSNSLSACISVSLGGVSQKKTNFIWVQSWLIVFYVRIHSQHWNSNGINTGPLYMFPINCCGLTSITVTTRIFVKILSCHCTLWFSWFSVIACLRRI